MPTDPLLDPLLPAPLPQLAAVLAAAVADPDPLDDLAPDVEDLPAIDEPALVRVRRAGGTVELAMRFGVGDPAVALRCTSLPEPWDAIGIVAPGTARPLPTDDATDDPPSDHAEPPACRIGFALLVDRTGASAHAVRAAGTDAPAWLTDGPSGPGRGRLVDACRRVVGQPTEPPTTAPSALWNALWLDAVVTWVLERPAGPHPWPVVASLHPAGTLLGIPADRLGIDGVLDEAARQLAAQRCWADARAAVAAGSIRVPGLDAADAEWFDDGAFSRAALEELPEVPDALSILDAVVAPSLLARVAAVVLHAARAAPAPHR